MNLEINEKMRVLRDHIDEFIGEMDDIIPVDHDLEYEFMEDESGISNTETDTLIENLEGTVTLIEKLLGK
jgi:hypothetical protein